METKFAGLPNYSYCKPLAEADVIYVDQRVQSQSLQSITKNIKRAPE